MKAVPEAQRVAAHLWFWEAYEPAVKCDLSCVALRSEAGWIFIDPIPLAVNAMAEILEIAPAAAVVATSGNHERACCVVADALGVPFYAPECEVTPDRRLAAGQVVFGDVAVHAVPGAGPGEIALWHAASRTLCLGDAVIHLPSHGFALLPEKYCADFRAMRGALDGLCDLEPEIITFAHGTPILVGAREKLRALLAE